MHTLWLNVKYTYILFLSGLISEGNVGEAERPGVEEMELANDISEPLPEADSAYKWPNSQDSHPNAEVTEPILAAVQEMQKNDTEDANIDDDILDLNEDLSDSFNKDTTDNVLGSLEAGNQEDSSSNNVPNNQEEEAGDDNAGGASEVGNTGNMVRADSEEKYGDENPESDIIVQDIDEEALLREDEGLYSI